MIFHLSIEADDPQRVAEGLAQIMGGEAFPFPPVGVGSWAAVAGDQFGTMIEVYRRGTHLHQGPNGVVSVEHAPSRHSATHFAIGTDLDVEALRDIVMENGWTAKYCRRDDRFGLVEIWIDGCVMFEVLTKLMQAEYLDTVTIENFREMARQAPIELAGAA